MAAKLLVHPRGAIKPSRVAARRSGDRQATTSFFTKLRNIIVFFKVKKAFLLFFSCNYIVLDELNTVNNMTEPVAVAIIGAGPYGLSIAAHLAARNIPPMVFGTPMKSWRAHMPRGMRLKSEGFASCLSDPDGAFTLEAFCRAGNLPYADMNLPVAVGTFAAYGEAFQRRFVPQADPRDVRALETAPHGFTLELEDGTKIEARRVIVAAGIGHFKQIPQPLASHAPDWVSHTHDHSDYSDFAGRRVAVVGAGASAIDAAADLRRAGAEVSLITRNPSVRFYSGRSKPRLVSALLAPRTPLGPGWKKLLCVKAPLLFRLLPARFRASLVNRHLGPAPGWFIRDEVEGKVPFILSSTVIAARPEDGAITLTLETPDGQRTQRAFDHVVAGTGFTAAVDRIPFLGQAVLSRLALNGRVPKLSSHFESSLRGLYFVGTISAYEFGPLLRFVCGAGFASARIAKHIAAAERRGSRVQTLDQKAGVVREPWFGLPAARER